jgi:hypothetical protein
VVKVVSLVIGITILLAGRSAGSSEAAAWQVETVDQGGVGKFSSLKID